MDKERQEIILNDVKELFNQGKYQECVSLIKNTLLQQGIHIKLLTYLGASYANLKNYGLAMAAFTQYLYYVPNNVEIITNLAAVFYDLGDLHFAEEYLNKALQLNPDFPLLNKNLALFYFEMGDIPKALHYYHLAVKLMDTDSAHLGLSHALLCANHFTEGWREYEYRVSTLEYNSSFTFPFPRWQGEDLNNKTLCIYTEQG
ncbi:MAG: tetratricopeptide repeat protein, partial [Gammaproteobacteria bacterium]